MARKKLTLKPRRVDVPVDDDWYACVEASEAAATEHRNMTSEARRYNDAGGFAGWKGLHDVQDMLVGECVYRVEKEGAPIGKPVGREAVKAWPSGTVAELYDTVRDLSPGLSNELTVEDLDRQIARLTAQRDELKARESGADPTRNTGGTSG